MIATIKRPAPAASVSLDPNPQPLVKKKPWAFSGLLGAGNTSGNGSVTKNVTNNPLKTLTNNEVTVVTQYSPIRARVREGIYRYNRYFVTYLYNQGLSGNNLVTVFKNRYLFWGVFSLKALRKASKPLFLLEKQENQLNIGFLS